MSFALDRKKTGLWSVAILLALAAPVAIYIFYILKYSANVPFWDDYESVLAFLNQYVPANGLHDKLALVFAQHNEHRTVFNNIIELAQYRIAGKTDFVQLIILGNTGWILTVYVLYAEFRGYGIGRIYFLPVMLVMFSFSIWEPMIWAMCSIQFFYGVLFPLASLYFLCRRPGLPGFVLCLLFMGLSVFTSSSGFALLPVALAALLSRKRVAESAIALFVAALLLLTYFYFLKYVKPPYEPPYAVSPAGLSKFALAFLGSAISRSVLADMVFGFLFFLAFIGLGAKGLYKRDGGFVFWAAFMAVLTGIEVATGRSGFGLRIAMASRYTVFSVLLISLLYLGALSLLKDKKGALKKFGAVCLAFSLVFYAVAFSRGAYQIKLRHRWLESKTLVYDNPAQAALILMESERLGIYHRELAGPDSLN